MMAGYLVTGMVITHPYVLGELAMGNLRDRAMLLDDLRRLQALEPAMDTEVSQMVEQHRLYGLGIGYIDAHLLTSVQLSPGTTLWTRDKRLHAVAEKLRLAHVV
jgi:hypothetical protein